MWYSDDFSKTVGSFHPLSREKLKNPQADLNHNNLNQNQNC